MNSKLMSKIGKFQEMGTNPKDYLVMTNKVYSHIENCQICGAALDYSFLLAHKDSTEENTDKNLLIGRDCAEAFAEVYLPYAKEQLKKKLLLLVETEKCSIFLEKNPKIKEIAQEINTYLNNIYKEFYAKDMNQTYYSFRNSSFFRNIQSDVRSILRKNYLSKPKTAKVYKIYEAIQNGQMWALMEKCHGYKSKKIAEVIDSEKKFYNWYIKEDKQATPEQLENILKQVALDVFQKQDRLLNKKMAAGKKEIIKGAY